MKRPEPIAKIKAVCHLPTDNADESNSSKCPTTHEIAVQALVCPSGKVSGVAQEGRS
jgi:hypothetical protein